jgi:hypothetical protein
LNLELGEAVQPFGGDLGFDHCKFPMNRVGRLPLIKNYRIKANRGG